MEPYFVYNGKDSRDMGLWVKSYPSIVRPAERFQEITIPGRPGSLTLLEGIDVFEPYIREVQIIVKPDADIHDIMRWLVGRGIVNFGNEPDLMQKARVYDEVNFQREIVSLRSATVRFLCDPFKSSIFDTAIIEVDVSSSPYTLKGCGDVIAYPTFELTGTGNCSLFVGTTEIALTGLDNETAVIDCESKTAYKTVFDGLTSHIENIVTYGDFATLSNNESTLIAWSEGVSGLVIHPNWRWL